MNKKGLSLKDGLFAIVVFSSFMIAALTLSQEFYDIYGTGDSLGGQNLEKLDEISSTTGGFRGQITTKDVESGEDPETSTFRGVYGILSRTFTYFDLVIGQDGILDNVAKEYGIPDFIVKGIITLIFIAITFSLIAIIFRLARSTA